VGADGSSSCRLEVYEGRHHFDPPHRIEPERLAARLRELWERAAQREGASGEERMLR
jgi:hypothetical protein